MTQGLNWFTTRFLSFSTTGILGKMILCYKGCPAHCRILGLYSRASCASPVVTSKSTSRHCKCPPGARWANLPPVENHWFRTVFLGVTGFYKIIGQWTDPEIKVHKSLTRHPSTKQGNVAHWPPYSWATLWVTCPHYIHFLPTPFPMWICHDSGENLISQGGRGNIMGNCFIVFQSTKARSFCILMKGCANWKILLSIQPCYFKLWATLMRIIKRKKTKQNVGPKWKGEIKQIIVK